MTRHPAYVLFMVLLVQPLNGVIIQRGQILLGLTLIACQLPWALSLAIRQVDIDIRHRTA